MGKLARVVVLVLLTVTGLVSVVGAAVAAVSSTPTRSWSLNGRVYASAVIGNEIVLGGAFTQATSPDGVVRAASRLVAFDAATGALVTGFTASADGDVTSMTTDGTTVWVGGAFTHLNGVADNHLGAVSATTGATRTRFVADASAKVMSLDVRDGKVYIGGDFTTVNKVARTRIAAVDGATGAVDPTFVSSADARVSALRVAPNRSTVYLAGSFTTVGGVTRTGMAAVSPTTGATSSLVFAGALAPTLALDVSSDGSMVYAGRGGTSNSAVGWRTSTGARVWSVTADGDVQAIRYAAGRVFFGFHDGYRGVTTTKLLSADPVTGVVSSFRPVFDGFWGSYTLAVAGGYLVDGGEFTKVSGVPAGDWARFPIT